MASNFSSALFYRDCMADVRAIDGAEREFNLSFSSEHPVRRWFGTEVLLHGEENVDLRRLRSMGAMLVNHDPNQIAGPIREAFLDTDAKNGRRGRARVRFDDDAEAEKSLKKVRSGSLSGVSVGYIIHNFRELQEGEEWEGWKGPVFLATKWEPVEISLTPIPADSTVGVGRAASRSLEGIQIEKHQPTQEKPKMEATQTAASNSGQSTIVKPAPALDKQLYERAVALGMSELVLKMVAEEKSPDAIRDAMVDELVKRAGKATPPAQPAQPENQSGQAQRTLEGMSPVDFAAALSNLSVI